MLKQNKTYRENGIVLVVVLWIIFLMTLMVLSFMSTIKTTVLISSTEGIISRKNSAINSGLELAVYELLKNKNNNICLQNEKRYFKNFDEFSLEIRIASPAGLLDLNSTDPLIILNFLKARLGNTEKAVSIKNQIQNARPRKTEKKETSPKNKINTPKIAFIDVTQLRSLNGVDKNSYNILAPYFTVYNIDSRVNLLYSNEEILKAVPGITRLTARDIVDRCNSYQDNKFIFDDVLSRSRRWLSAEQKNIYKISILANNNNKNRIGKEYIIVLGLNAQSPYHILSSKEIRK